MLRSLPGRLFSLVLSMILAGPLATASARADDCSNEKSLKSQPSATQSELSFQNRSAEKRRIYWIDQDGDRKFYGIVEPGNVFKQPTLADHAWVVTDDAEKCLFTFVAAAEPRTVSVGEAAAAAPPPPGGQQPIAQAAPPPPPVQASPPPVQAAPQPIVQAAPPVVQAAQPPGPQDPATVIASTAAEQLPQVSPVEQFQLNGNYRLATQVDGSKVLNSQASGTLDVAAARPEWDSAQWMFEPVGGTPFVRIRNKWKGTYLADFNGKPRAMPAAPNATETQWTFEPVDGTPFVQFRNRETDRFLLAINGAPALVDDFRQDMENFSLWRPLPAASAAVAPPPPPRPLYDSAVSSCRQIGGYWTGSSCRRPVYLTQPLVCPRGFAWAEEHGECVWDGGSCPPWQLAPGGICGPNLVCRGGVVAPGARGFPACYCPAGQVAWGNYPNLSCVPSVARVAPLLIPAVIAGTAIAIIGSNQGRPTIGQVYGNNRFCPPGATGTPPNCVAAQTCPAPLVGTPPNCQRLVQPIQPIKNPFACPAGQVRAPNDACVTITCAGGTMSQGACVCPAGSTRQGGGANFQCVAATTPPAPTPVCGAGQTLQNGLCVNVAPVITCTGGRIEQGVCGCPAGTQLTGGGNSFQCVASTGGGTPPAPICNLGERLVDGKCVNLNAAITCIGGRIEQGVCGCPAGTRLTGGGNNFQCVASTGGGTPPTPTCNLGERLVDGKCVNLNAAITCTGGRIEQGVCGCPAGTQLTGGGNNFQCVASTGGGTQQTCAPGFTGTPPNCVAVPPPPPRPPGAPPLCTDGQNTASGCQCAAPLTVLPGGKCTQPTRPGAACLEGQNIAATGCNCVAPLKPIENGFCGRLLLNETKPIGKGGVCTEGADIKATGCICNMNTVDMGGGRFVCSASRTPAPAPVGGGGGGPPLCADGQNTASGCRCAAPLTVLPGGKCAQPTRPGAPCLEGQNIAQTGCSCVAPLKPIENGFCGRLLLNETKPVGKGGICTEGADIKATSCICNMNTVDMGGGRFVCSASRTPAPAPVVGGGGGPPLCADGQNTASGCRCAAPLTVLPGGKCAQPTRPGAPCLEGQNIAQTGCSCVAPLKPIENGFCGRLLLNETRPVGKGGVCSEGADIKATSCICNMKTVDVGGGKFICSANAQPGVKPATGADPNCPNCRVAPPKQGQGQGAKPPAQCPTGTTGTPPNCVAPPPAQCPAGQTGTPPNCRPAQQATCPAGFTGTPPNCARQPPAQCPAGMTGTPPNCVKPPPAQCPAGFTGTPPNCVKPPPAQCPAGFTGTPPNCARPLPAQCPAGLTGTPPNCVRPPPAQCPAGTTGTPPNCLGAQPVRPQGCVPPKKLTPQGCV